MFSIFTIHQAVLNPIHKFKTIISTLIFFQYPSIIKTKMTTTFQGTSPTCQAITPVCRAINLTCLATEPENPFYLQNLETKIPPKLVTWFIKGCYLVIIVWQIFCIREDFHHHRVGEFWSKYSTHPNSGHPITKCIRIIYFLASGTIQIPDTMVHFIASPFYVRLKCYCQFYSYKVLFEVKTCLKLISFFLLNNTI